MDENKEWTNTGRQSFRARIQGTRSGEQRRNTIEAQKPFPNSPDGPTVLVVARFQTVLNVRFLSIYFLVLSRGSTDPVIAFSTHKCRRRTHTHTTTDRTAAAVSEQLNKRDTKQPPLPRTQRDYAGGEWGKAPPTTRVPFPGAGNFELRYRPRPAPRLQMAAVDLDAEDFKHPINTILGDEMFSMSVCNWDILR